MALNIFLNQNWKLLCLLSIQRVPFLYYFLCSMGFNKFRLVRLKLLLEKQILYVPGPYFYGHLTAVLEVGHPAKFWEGVAIPTHWVPCRSFHICWQLPEMPVLNLGARRSSSESGSSEWFLHSSDKARSACLKILSTKKNKKRVGYRHIFCPPAFTKKF